MANQSPDRRAVLEMLAKVGALSQFPGFVRWAAAVPQTAHEHPPAPTHTGSHAVYQPRFFEAGEYATVDRLSDLIIPSDETPGAHEAGVAEFIDFMAHADAEIQAPFREGLALLDSDSRAQYGKPFRALGESDQIAWLQKQSSEGSAGHKFFLLIRRYTVMGYYTSRVGLEALDYPGLKFYSKSPACPHHGDPEHLHLSERKTA